MAVLINFKICDNAPECSGIEVCPTKAITYNEEKQTVEIDNSRCISCGLCEKACPIGAFKVAKTEEEYKKIEKEIENDPRTTKDLFVDRYGAASISDFFKITEDEIEEKVKKDGLVLIEIYHPDSAMCLLKSIPIKELTNNLPKDTLFYKVETDRNMEQYKVKEYPCLLLFKKGKLLGRVEGYYSVEDKDILLDKLNAMIHL